MEGAETGDRTPGCHWWAQAGVYRPFYPFHTKLSSTCQALLCTEWTERWSLQEAGAFHPVGHQRVPSQKLLQSSREAKVLSPVCASPGQMQLAAISHL